MKKNYKSISAIVSDTFTDGRNSKITINFRSGSSTADLENIYDQICSILLPNYKKPEDKPNCLGSKECNLMKLASCSCVDECYEVLHKKPTKQPISQDGKDIELLKENLKKIEDMEKRLAVLEKKHLNSEKNNTMPSCFGYKKLDVRSAKCGSCKDRDVCIEATREAIILNRKSRVPPSCFKNSKGNGVRFVYSCNFYDECLDGRR